MNLALNEARLAFSNQEVPVGAVLVKENKIISQSFNQSISKKDPSGHAEMNVLRDASKKLNNYRLNGCSLYVTLEPCLMCFGACVHARISKLIYGADDLKIGAVKSNLEQINSTKLNHKFEIISGILKEECAEVLSSFFKEKRLKN